MKLFGKINGGALQFVLFIGTVVALLLMGFMLISFTHRHFSKNTEITIDLVKAADRSMKLAMSQADLSQPFVDLSMSPIISTTSKGQWGIFELYSTVVGHQEQKFTKTALVGSGLGPTWPALYLQDRQRPLIVAGNALIKGDAYLPQQGIRLGHVAGSSYSHDQLLYGQQKQSAVQLPPLKHEVTKAIQSLIEFRPGMNAKRLQLGQGTKLTNSFTKATQVVQGEFIILEEIQLTGNIIVQAWEKIVVAPTAMLTDVILLAPEIEIRDGFQGSFQAIASRKISVGSGVQLSYPSALVVADRSGAGQWQSYGIQINTGSDIRGILAFISEKTDAAYQPQIYIDENAIITGEVYNSHNLELKGQVMGSVITSSFISLENGSIYQNHLFNGQIDAEQLSHNFGGLLLEDRNSKSVAKWLY